MPQNVNCDMLSLAVEGRAKGPPNGSIHQPEVSPPRDGSSADFSECSVNPSLPLLKHVPSVSCIFSQFSLCSVFTRQQVFEATPDVVVSGQFQQHFRSLPALPGPLPLSSSWMIVLNLAEQRQSRVNAGKAARATEAASLDHRLRPTLGGQSEVLTIDPGRRKKSTLL